MNDTSFESRQWRSFADKNKTHRLATANLKKFNPSALLLLIFLCTLWYVAAKIVAKPFVFPYFDEVVGELIDGDADLRGVSHGHAAGSEDHHSQHDSEDLFHRRYTSSKIFQRDSAR